MFGREMVSRMNCANCGSELKVGAKFCANCGSNVQAQTQQFTYPVSQTPIAVAPTNEPIGGSVLYQRNNQRTVAIACMVVIAIVVAALIALFFWKSSTPKELKLESNTIKDEALKNSLVVSYDKDGDGKLSEEELGEVQNLELDSGDEYDYLYLFWNLRTLNVKNQDVTYLDLSNNSNLESVDVEDATRLVELKLPLLPNYENIKLPENDDLEVIFPENSEYEMKYVPRKVTESTIYVSPWGNTSKTTTFTQDVESATQIDSLTFQEQGSSGQKISYSYDSLGRVSSWGNTKDIVYDENNQVESEASRVQSASFTTMNADYEDDGDVANTSVPSANSASGIEVRQEGDTLSLVNPQTSTRGGYWKFKDGNLSEATLHLGTNGGYYTKWNYAWNGNSPESLVLTLLDNNYGSVPNLNSIEAYESIKVGGSDTISFKYDGNNLASATYSSGFTQNFSYDAHGNLKSVTSTGTPSSLCMDITTNCLIEYAKVIGKKNANALTFLTLLGLNSQGLFNQATSVRGITLAGAASEYTPFTQDFTGKFWWDEENIINEQVEKTQSSKNASKLENSQN